MRCRGASLVACVSALYLLCAAFGMANAQGVRYEPPEIQGYEPLDDGQRGQNPLTAEHPALLQTNTSLFRDTAIIDFEKRQITFIRYDKRFELPVWRYHYDELAQYLASRQRFVFRSHWARSRRLAEKDDDFRKGISQLDFRLPVHYPAWARRVLGKEPPKLTIDGYQEIGLAYEWGSVDRGVGDPESKTPGIDFVQNNDFTIRGSVGRLISIEMRAGTDQEFDVSNPMEQLKIEYKEDSLGELEDEIIQEVVAGWTNFEMPGGGLVGFAESHEGLFGIKVRSKFGPLTLTSIVSQEQGQLQKKEIRPNQIHARPKQLKEEDFLKNAYFFLDSLYMQKYIGDVDAAPEVTELRVYHWTQTRRERDKINEEYLYALFGDNTEAQLVRRLWEDEQYEFFPNEGYIRFHDSVSIRNDDIIAIYMRTADSSRIAEKGDTSIVPANNLDALANLWVLKNQRPEETDSTYWLMWRNVYRMPDNVTLDKFDITIRNVSGDTAEQVDNVYFSQILGLADENGEPLKQISDIYDFINGHIVVPPYGDTALGNLPFTNPSLGKTNEKSNTNSAIYRYPPYNANYSTEVENQYLIEMVGESKTASYELGWGIMEGSVNVTRGHSKEKLRENIDYTLDYQSGYLTLISDRAKTADLIEVEYQQESHFVFDRRTFMGLQGQVDLPGIGKNSYLLGRALYQNTTAREDVPKVGHEPYNKLALEANTSFDFEPEWMTQLVNMIPLVKTSARSSAKFDAKIAKTTTSPNSSGEAYIDNFESADSPDELGLSQYSWRQASPPADFVDQVERRLPDGSVVRVDSLLWRPPAWHSYWFSPEGKDRTRKDSIWVLDEEFETSSDWYANTMRWVVDPAPGNELAADYDNPWAGIMTSFQANRANRENDQFLELWVKNAGGGKLYVDMGDVSEQISIDGGPPNNLRDREDTSQVGLEITYNPKLDKGLDTLLDTGEVYVVPDLDALRWDTLAYGDDRLESWKNDPSRDNFRHYTVDSLENSVSVNGTQGNENAETEDLNRDGIIEPPKNENVFRAVVDFDNIEESPFLDENTNAANPQWRRILIPLNTEENLEQVGTPSWQRIRFVRLWWSDFSESAKNRLDTLEFARIQFVGNKWRAVSDSAGIRPSVLNTEDDPMYFPPPLKRREREQGDADEFVDDYALRLVYGGLESGDEALVEYTYSYEPLDLSSYDKVRMFVRFHDEVPTDPGSWFVYRFGRDDSTYYEFRQRAGSLQYGWTRGVEIDLKDLARLKLDALIDNNNEVDSMRVVHARPNGSQYRILSKTGILPAFSDIKWMALGVARDSGGIGIDTGDVWINGLRATGGSALSGWAFTGSFSTHWADFMDLSVDMSYEDADFRQMSERLLSGRDSRMAGSVGAQWSLDKFLPSKWGVSIPVGGNLSSSLSRPRLKPNSDIDLTDAENKPDNLADIAEDFAGKVFKREFSDTVTDAEHYETWSVNRSWYTSFSKSARAKNPLVNMTVDRISSNLRYVRDTSITSLGPDSTGTDKVDLQSTRTYTFGLTYDLSPRNPPAWTSWRPFENVEASWMPRQMKRYELSLLPRTFSFDVADLDWYRRIAENQRTGNSSSRRRLGLDHGFQFAYSPVSPILDIDYTLSIGRDLADELERFKRESGQGDASFAAEFIRERVLKADTAWKDYYLTRGEDVRDQHFGVELNPEFVEWLSHRFDYSGDYNHRPTRLQRDSLTSYLTANVTSSFGFTSDLRLYTLVSNLAQKTAGDSGAANAFAVLEGALGKINLRNINFRYDVSSSLTNDFLSADYLRENNVTGFYDYFLYQIGLRDRGMDLDFLTGDMDDEADFGGMNFRTGNQRQDSLDLHKNDKRSVQASMSFGTGMRLPSPIDLDLNTISLGWRRNYTREPDSTSIDTTITWPEAKVNARWSILEKISFIKKVMNTVSLNSNYSFTRSRTVLFRSGKEVRIEISNSLSPLVGIRGTLKKWPVNVNYTYDFSTDTSFTTGDTTGAKGVSSSHRFDVSHSIRSSRLSKIKVLRWTIPIEGELAMGMEFERSQDQDRIGGVVQSKVVRHSLTPHLAYDFTENVRGTASYSGSWYEREGNNVDAEKTNDHQISILVRITF